MTVHAGPGGVTLAIADANGATHSYTIAPAAPALADWAVLLTRLDTGRVYRVELAGQSWRCSCEAARYRKRGAGPCKHVIALAPLYHLMRQLMRGHP